MEPEALALVVVALLDFTIQEGDGSTQWWEIATAFGTIASAAAAVYFGAIQHLLRGPNLSLEYDRNEPTDAQLVGLRQFETVMGEWQDAGKAAYARLRVENSGSQAAEDVELVVWKVEDRFQYLGVQPRPNLSDMSLKISNSSNDDTRVNVAPGAARHIDFVHMRQGRSTLWVDVHPEPADGRNRLQKRFSLRFELVLSAKNARATRYQVDVDWLPWPDGTDEPWDHFRVSKPVEIHPSHEWPRLHFRV